MWANLIMQEFILHFSATSVVCEELAGFEQRRFQVNLSATETQLEEMIQQISVSCTLEGR